MFPKPQNTYHTKKIKKQELFFIFVTILLDLLPGRGFLGNKVLGAGLNEVRFPGIGFLVGLTAETPLPLFFLLLEPQQFFPSFVTFKTAAVSRQWLPPKSINHLK
jgi:hypothetical protein